MKKVIFTFLFLVPLIYPQTQWYWQNPKPTGEELFHIFFSNESNGWIQRSDGVMKTTDGGVSWEYLVGSDTMFISDMDFVNDDIGFMLQKRKLYKTTNGGSTWFHINIDNFYFNDIFFLDEKVGFIAGFAFFKTEDGGETWQLLLNVQQEHFYRSIACTDLNNITLIDYGGYIIRTTDGGFTWQEQTNPYFMGFLSEVTFTDNNNGFITVIGKDAMGGIGGILKTTNGGNLWVMQNMEDYEDIYFLNKDVGYIWSRYRMRKTTDGGHTWFFTPLRRISSMFFLNELVGFGINWYDGYICKTTDGGDSWIELSSSIDNGFLFDIKFFDHNTGIATGENGILRTTNRGATWDYALKDTFANYISIVEGNYGTIASYWGGIILRTSDKGNTWQRQNTPLGMFTYFYGLSFSDKNYGIITAGNGKILKTTNGGENWFLQADLSDSNIIASYVHLIDSLNGIIIASKDQKKRILRTFNGGKNWITIYSSPNNKEKYSSISFADKNNGVIIGIEETLQPINNFNIFIFKTSNGGIIWDKKIVKSLKTSVGAYIAYPDVKNCFILYNNNQMMKSTDGGNTWSSEIIPINNHSISAMHFIDAQTTYLVGYRSEIISNVDANNSILLHDEVGYYKSVRFSLTQNYPNPFNPSTKIKYSLPKQGMVTIKVYDVLGKEVVQIVDEEKNPGEYEINFNGNGLSSGIYFYQIQAGEFIQTKKMVLMK